tara:strand:+ start:613 stop:3099 length:2487 start_codon:yes stop_codon:yes gene_type:complete
MKNSNTTLSMSTKSNKTITSLITESRVIDSSFLVKMITNNAVVASDVTTLVLQFAGSLTGEEAVNTLLETGLNVNLAYTALVDDEENNLFRALLCFDELLTTEQIAKMKEVITLAFKDDVEYSRTELAIKVLDTDRKSFGGRSIIFLNYEVNLGYAFLNTILRKEDEKSVTQSSGMISKPYMSTMPEALYTLKNGQYLSDTMLKGSDIINKALVARTNSGKTNFVINNIEGKKIIILPSYNATIEVASSYNGVYFNQSNKDLSKAQDLIVTTVQSFPLLASLVNLSEFTVILDEFHTLTTNGSKTFMYSAITDLIDTLAKHRQKATVLISATPIRNVHPFILGFETVLVESEGVKATSYTDLIVDDKANYIKEAFAKGKIDNRFTAVLFNNTNDGLDAYMKMLEADYNVNSFNSTTKATEPFVKMIETGLIDENSDGFFCTTALKEATSLKFVSNTRFTGVNLIILGNHSDVTAEQLQARFRNATNIEVTIVRSKDFVSSTHTFDVFKAETLMLQAASRNVKDFNSRLGSTNPYDSRAITVLDKFANTFTKNTEYGFEIDFVSISNEIYEADSKAVWTNTAVLAERLASYGWTYKGIASNKAVMSKDDANILKSSKKEIKAARLEQQAVILETIKLEGLDANITLLEGSEEIETKEKTIRHKVAYISRYVTDVDKVLEVFDECASTTQAYNTLQTQVMMRKVLTDSTAVGREDRVLIDAIYSEFKVDESISGKDALTRLKAVLAKNITYKTVGKLTQIKAVKMLSWLFEVKIVMKKDSEGKRYKEYSIKSTNPIPFDINTDKFNGNAGITGVNETVKQSTLINFGLFA